MRVKIAAIVWAAAACSGCATTGVTDSLGQRMSKLEADVDRLSGELRLAAGIRDAVVEANRLLAESDRYADALGAALRSVGWRVGYDAEAVALAAPAPRDRLLGLNPHRRSTESSAIGPIERWTFGDLLDGEAIRFVSPGRKRDNVELQIGAASVDGERTDDRRALWRALAVGGAVELPFSLRLAEDLSDKDAVADSGRCRLRFEAARSRMILDVEFDGWGTLRLSAEPVR